MAHYIALLRFLCYDSGRTYRVIESQHTSKQTPCRLAELQQSHNIKEKCTWLRVGRHHVAPLDITQHDAESQPSVSTSGTVAVYCIAVQDHATPPTL